MLTHVPAKPLVTLFPIRFDVQASAWPGCNFEFFSFRAHSMGQLWRAQGEHLLGGTGTLTQMGGRFAAMCEWRAESYGNRHASKPSLSLPIRDRRRN